MVDPFLPSGSLQEPQPVHQAESLLTAKPMEEISRENREIEQLQMQLKMQIDKSEHKILDLEAEKQALKQKLNSYSRRFKRLRKTCTEGRSHWLQVDQRKRTKQYWKRYNAAL